MLSNEEVRLIFSKVKSDTKKLQGLTDDEKAQVRFMTSDALSAHLETIESEEELDEFNLPPKAKSTLLLALEAKLGRNKQKIAKVVMDAVIKDYVFCVKNRALFKRYVDKAEEFKISRIKTNGKFVGGLDSDVIEIQ